MDGPKPHITPERELHNSSLRADVTSLNQAFQHLRDTVREPLAECHRAASTLSAACENPETKRHLNNMAAHLNILVKDFTPEEVGAFRPDNKAISLEQIMLIVSQDHCFNRFYFKNVEALYSHMLGVSESWHALAKAYHAIDESTLSKPEQEQVSACYDKAHTYLLIGQEFTQKLDRLSKELGIDRMVARS